MIRLEFEGVQQTPERVVAALQVANGVDGHVSYDALVQKSGDGESEWCNRCIEAEARIRLHPIQALHRADRRFEHGAARILERLTRLQMRLFADHAVAVDFLHPAIGVGDDPVAAQQAAPATLPLLVMVMV